MEWHLGGFLNDDVCTRKIWSFHPRFQRVVCIKKYEVCSC